MTKPSDFTPDRVLEVEEQPEQPDTSHVTRQIWISRVVGLGLLATALVVIAAFSGFATEVFFVNSAILISFTTYVVIAETRSRRSAVNMEKRLRLGLLVHNMQLENMAMQDDLTQLFNRRYFFERLERELETAKAFKRPLSVIVTDLDSMKYVNDNFGHRIGDDLLSGFGRFLLDQTRASDVPARIGGDEFAIILPDTSDRAAVGLKDRLARRLENTDMVDRGDIQLKAAASFGVASYPGGGDSVDEIMQRADVDMYAHKATRKGQASSERVEKAVEPAMGA